MKNKKTLLTKLFSICAGLFLLFGFSVSLTKVSNIGPVYASGDTKHLGKVTDTNDIKENTNYYCVYIHNNDAYVFNGGERTSDNSVTATVDSNNQIALTSDMAAIQFEKKSGYVYYVKIASGKNNVGKYIYASSNDRVELEFDDGKYTNCESNFSMFSDNYICICSEHCGTYLKCKYDTHRFAFAPSSNGSYRDIYLYKEVEETGPAIGDSFADNGINYEITAVGDVNTVKVGHNNSYAGDTVNIPAKVTYKGIEFSVTAIGEDAFGDCPNLTNVTLSEGLLSIESFAFQSIWLSSITIPSTVNSIDNFAFADNSSLTTVICKGTTPPSLVSAFDMCDNLIEIKVPASSFQAYKEASGWSDYAEKIVGYYTIGSILPDDFPALSEVSIPENTWKNANNYFCGRWKNDSWDKLFFCKSPSSHINIDCSNETVACEGGYKYSDSNITVVFLIENDVLTGINFISTKYTDYEGTYTPPTPTLTYTVTVINSKNGTVAPTYSEKVAKDTAYTVNGNKLTIGETEITATPNKGYKFDYWKIGYARLTQNGTITGDTTFSPEFTNITLEDFIPDTFPSIIQDGWVNENNYRLYFNDSGLCIGNERFVDFVPGNSVYYDVTENAYYSESSYMGHTNRVTFNLKENSEEIESVTITKNYELADTSKYGTYVPTLNDSNDTLDLEDCNLTYSLNNGTVNLSLVSGDYKLEAELYIDSGLDTIPAGTYVINESQESGTALASSGVINHIPQKSFAALYDDGEIVDCWLLSDGLITLSYENNKLKAVVDAENTKGNAITVTGIFTPSYATNVVAGSNGTISQSYSKDLLEGTSYTIDGNKLTIDETEITATPNEGYEFDCWKIGETKVTGSGTITADTTFTATFKAQEVPSYSVNVVAGQNGTISSTFTEGVQKDTSYTVNGNKLTIGGTEITATPNEGYEFDCWKIGETKVTAGGTIGEDTTFTASFKATEKPVPQPENKGLSGGAIAGISVGAIAGVALISYAVMFLVYAKSGKGLKFLFKSFDWLKKLFKMK